MPVAIAQLDFGLVLFVFLAAFLSVFIITFLIRRLASAFSIVDEPGKRKVHIKPMPLLGGVAIYAGFLIALAVNPQVWERYWSLFFSSSIILILGLLDDMRGLSAKIRFLFQCLAAGVLIYGGFRITFFPYGFWWDAAEIVITVIWLVGVTNAFNYLDGLNGLACGSAAINLSYFSLILFATGQSNLGAISIALAGACFGFLPHNFRRARIFLGDAGSTFLGFFLAAIAVTGTWASDNIIRVSMPILILGVPIFDMTFTTIMRIKEKKIKNIGEWLAYSGRDHFHHYLVHLGLSPAGSTYFIWAMSFYLGLSAFMLANDPAWEAVLTVLQASLIFTIIGVLIVIGRRRKSGWGRGG